jgi:hypothetical protein
VVKRGLSEAKIFGAERESPSNRWQGDGLTAIPKKISGSPYPFLRRWS